MYIEHVSDTNFVLLLQADPVDCPPLDFHMQSRYGR